MKTEFVNNIANAAIYQLQCDEKIYLVNKKINKILLILFCSNFLFDCNSRLIVFKTSINLLLELFLNFIVLRKSIFYVISTNFV